MIARFDEKTREIALSGTRGEFRALADALIGTASPAIQLQQTVPLDALGGYSRTLRELGVELQAAGHVSVTVERDTMKIMGSKASLSLFGVNIRDFSEQEKIGNHWHAEYFEEHMYLAPSSYPVVFSLCGV